MGNDEMKYYVWLQLCLGQGSKTFEHLLEDALLPSDIYSMTPSERKKVGYFSKGELDKMSKISIEDAVKIILCRPDVVNAPLCSIKEALKEELDQY